MNHFSFITWLCSLTTTKAIPQKVRLHSSIRIHSLFQYLTFLVSLKDQIGTRLFHLENEKWLPFDIFFDTSTTGTCAHLFHQSLNLTQCRLHCASQNEYVRTRKLSQQRNKRLQFQFENQGLFLYSFICPFFDCLSILGL